MSPMLLRLQDGKHFDLTDFLMRILVIVQMNPSLGQSTVTWVTFVFIGRFHCLQYSFIQMEF